MIQLSFTTSFIDCRRDPIPYDLAILIPDHSRIRALFTHWHGIRDRHRRQELSDMIAGACLGRECLGTRISIAALPPVQPSDSERAWDADARTATDEEFERLLCLSDER